jgi:hypothetical protein
MNVTSVTVVEKSQHHLNGAEAVVLIALQVLVGLFVYLDLRD